MMNDLHAKLVAAYTDTHPDNVGVPHAYRVVCKDGFSMSVQASKYHYCTPRDNFGPYTSFEVGFPTQQEELLLEYAEDRRNPTDTVYGYVPTDVVEAVVAKHGGVDEDVLKFVQ